MSMSSLWLSLSIYRAWSALLTLVIAFLYIHIYCIQSLFFSVFVFSVCLFVCMHPSLFILISDCLSLYLSVTISIFVNFLSITFHFSQLLRYYGQFVLAVFILSDIVGLDKDLWLSTLLFIPPLRINFCNFICLGHWDKSRSVINRIFSFFRGCATSSELPSNKVPCL